MCIKRTKQIGWKRRTKCFRQKSPYNEAKDVTFFEEVPDTYLKLTDDQFATFLSEDVHAPMIGSRTINKMIFKIMI